MQSIITSATRYYF